jgi:hypothetical protein
MRKFYAQGIKYDTDGEVIKGLPEDIVVTCESEDEVVDKISDATGWLVESVEVITEIVQVRSCPPITAKDIDRLVLYEKPVVMPMGEYKTGQERRRERRAKQRKK